MKQETCPCCHNHCPADNLNCGKGIVYFREREAEQVRKQENKEIKK